MTPECRRTPTVAAERRALAARLRALPGWLVESTRPRNPRFGGPDAARLPSFLTPGIPSLESPSSAGLPQGTIRALRVPRPELDPPAPAG